MEENTPERWVSSLRFSLPLLKCAVLRGFYLPDFSGAPSLPEHEEGGCCSSTGLLGHKGNAHVVQAVPGPGQAAEMPMLFEFSGFLTAYSMKEQMCFTVLIQLISRTGFMAVPNFPSCS